MKKPAAPLIPAKPAGANGLKSAPQPQTITLNFDQIELGVSKSVSKGFEGFRMAIDALQAENKELKAKLAKYEPAEGTKK